MKVSIVFLRTLLALTAFLTLDGFAQTAPSDKDIQQSYAGCMERQVGDWLAVINPIFEDESQIFGSTTFIEQYYSTSQASVKAMIIVSEIAGGILQGFDPRNFGGSRGGDRPFPDGIIANQDDEGIAARVGPIGLSWEVAAGEVDEETLFELASFSIDRACIAGITEAAEADDG